MNKEILNLAKRHQDALIGGCCKRRQRNLLHEQGVVCNPQTGDEMSPELMRDIHGMKEENESLREQLAKARKECEEQARLLGMSGEREAALLAKLEAVAKERDTLRTMVTSDCLGEEVCADAERYRWLRGK